MPDSNSYQDRWGIDHDCQCQEDFEVGKIDVVPECFLNFHDAAMTKLEEYHTKTVPELKSVIGHLRVQIVELGGVPRA